MVGGLAFFVFTFAKEEGCAVGESVVELLEAEGGVHGVIGVEWLVSCRCAHDCPWP